MNFSQNDIEWMAVEWSRRLEYHIFLIYQKLTVQDFNFQLFGILRVSTLRFGGSPMQLITFYPNLSGLGVLYEALMMNDVSKGPSINDVASIFVFF